MTGYRPRPEHGSELFELLMIRLDDFSVAVEADDFWGSGECAKHQDDSFIFSHVRDGLDAASSQVQIDDRPFINDPERCAIFW